VFEVLAGKLSAWRNDCAAVVGKSTAGAFASDAVAYHKISYRSEAVERLFGRVDGRP